MTVKPALVAPAATVTFAGTATAELLPARLTVSPPAGAAAVRVTVQVSDPVPDIVADVQETALILPAVTAVAVRFAWILPCEELLATVRTPV